MDDNESPRLWTTWLVDNGIWIDLCGYTIAEVLTGTFSEMAERVGCRGAIIYGANLSVYRIFPKPISQKIIDEFQVIEGKEFSWDAYENFEKQSELHEWYSRFNSIHPSEYLVFMTHDAVEGHTVFCRTYRDMLGVVCLLRGAFPE